MIRPSRLVAGVAPRPAVVALIMLAAVAAVLAVRVTVVFDGQVGGLVLAGTDFTDASQVSIPVLTGPGYDGQFLFRQAFDPFDYALASRDGIRLDLPIRFGRIGYPLLAWLLSGFGRPALLPWVLPLISATALAGVAWIFAAAARRWGRDTRWGWAATAIPGLWFAAGRDLSEPLSALLVLGGAYAIHRKSWGWVTVAWTAAVLVREQSVLLPVAFGLYRLIVLGGDWRRLRRIRLSGADLGWLVPGVALAGWSLTLELITGSTPAAVSTQFNLAWPGTALFPAVFDWLSPDRIEQPLWLLELVTFLAVAGWVLFNSRAELWERIAAGGGLLLAAVLSGFVLQDPAHFRQLGELWAVYTLVVLRLADFKPRAILAGVSVATTIGVIILTSTG